MERLAPGYDTEGVGPSLNKVVSSPSQNNATAKEQPRGPHSYFRKYLPGAMLLRTKLVLALTVVGAILVAISGAFTFYDFESDLAQRCLTRAEMASSMVKRALAGKSPRDNMISVLDALTGAPGIDLIALEDTEGRVIAASDPQWLDKSLAENLDGYKPVDITSHKHMSLLSGSLRSPALYSEQITDANDRFVGHVLVQINVADEAAALRAAAWNLIVWMVVGVIVSILIVSLILHRVVVAPIESLWRFAGNNAKGHRTSEAKDEIASIAEVLALSFEATATREIQLADLARHDGLTGLGNRSYFKSRLSQSIQYAEAHDEMLAVMILNLHKFKAVNDTLGHDSGDIVLQRTAEILHNCSLGNGFVARLGGDEFAIVINDVAGADEALEAANRLIRAVGAPLRVGPHEISLNSCMGVTLFPQDGRDKDMLLKNADLALSRAKHEGAGACTLYRHELHLRSIERNTIERDLRQAMINKELELYYQPKLNIVDGTVTGAEALIRWRHPERGYISPTVFIPVAENCGLIADLTRWVLDEACRQNREWQIKGLPKISVAVNVSAVDLRRPDLTDAIANLLVHRGLSPQYLEIEVTESMVMRDVDVVIGTLRRLRGLGIGISIDDFGTGYSSLAYLKRFPVKRLKIDQSFVSDITDKRGGQVIPKVIIDLAHALGVYVVAEGVETAYQLDVLRELGCDEAQGFLLGRPMMANEFEMFLQHSRTKQPTLEDKSRESAA
ncbi:MAG: EAL domain-containing protein [Rhizobiales bacterium]|nr:EAL domain-containing protein [Hyphomicrobiales bacterium]